MKKSVRSFAWRLLALIALQITVVQAQSIYDIKLKDIDGKDVALSDYKGKVLLIVNVASKCGYTKQYAGLEALYQKYKDKGVVVLGFPCNQFGGQEPGTESEIAEFCAATYNVKFPMFSKVEVNGPGAAPLYKHLTALDTQPKGKGDIKWNFEKFVIGKSGEVVARFAPQTEPILRGVRGLGVRRKPVLAFLRRDHLFNRWFGRLRSRSLPVAGEAEPQGV